MEKATVDNEAGYEIMTRTSAGVAMRFRWNFELDDTWSVSIKKADGGWGKPEAVPSNSPHYDALLQYFDLQNFRDNLNFGEIVYSSPKQLREIRDEKLTPH